MFAVIDWLNKWFSWPPFVAAEESDPRLRGVGVKIHNGGVDIRRE